MSEGVDERMEKENLRAGRESASEGVDERAEKRV